MISRLLMPLTILFSAATLTASAQELETIDITIHPAAAPRPLLAHRFLPTFREETPGNAAPQYLKAFLLLADRKVDEDTWDNVTHWAETALDEIPIGEAQQVLKEFDPVLREIEIAVLRERCNWSVGIRESDQPFAILLPEVTRAREVARLLALKVRLQVAQGQIDEALVTLRTGITLARHVAQQPTLISGLVGVAIVHLMTHQMETLMQAPDAPNLYWTLTVLPDPLADLRNGLKFEEVSLLMLFPQLNEVSSSRYTPDQWDRFALEIFHKARDMNTLVGEPEKVEWLTNLEPEKVTATEFPRARRRLLERGYGPQQIAAMPASQAVLLDFAQTYEEHRDQWYVRFYLPFWEARSMYLQEDAQFEEIKKQGLVGQFLTILLPTMAGVHDAATRSTQRIALLRTLESIRLHAAHHGQLPDRLTDVKGVPVPPDPFTGQPFAYRREGGRAVLEAHGRNDQVVRRYRLTLAESEN